jgi:hypothetical protein
MLLKAFSFCLEAVYYLVANQYIKLNPSQTYTSLAFSRLETMVRRATNNRINPIKT